MRNSAVVTAWGVNALDCLSSKLLKTISYEQISRVESFISAFILYDEVYLNERFSTNKLVSELNSSTRAIKFIKSVDLYNSDDERNHISFDVDLHKFSFDELSKDNTKWQYMHNPSMAKSIIFLGLEDEPKIKNMFDGKYYTQFRLWVWCLANEMAEHTKSVCLLPLSMNDIQKFSNKSNINEHILNYYIDYAQRHNQKFVKLSESISEPFISELSNIPPFFSLFLYRCKSNNSVSDVLISLREDYSEFRALRHKFTSQVSESETILEKQHIVKEWNDSWASLVSGEFKKPSLLNNTISSTDVSNILISVGNAAPKKLVKHILDYKDNKKSYNHFRVFSHVESEIDGFKTNFSMMKDVFGVEDIWTPH